MAASTSAYLLREYSTSGKQKLPAVELYEKETMDVMQKAANRVAGKDVLVPPEVDDRSKPHRASKHKRWGVDNKQNNEYWFDRRIHTLGNVGFLGGFHAACAPLSTKLIDIMAYEGKDVRNMVSPSMLLDT